MYERLIILEYALAVLEALGIDIEECPPEFDSAEFDSGITECPDAIDRID